MPLMQGTGADEKRRARLLGDGGAFAFLGIDYDEHQMGFACYGVLLGNAARWGHVGRCRVVSGHIRGLTNTADLQGR